MPLLALWATNKEAVDQFSIEQVVATAGDGVLRDQSLCSQELREYLSQTSTKKIEAYVAHCLGNSFTKSGMVLQDLVNELGRRLEYDVTNGRYQGTTNLIGFDGLWISPDDHTVVAEVKTTDSYRVSLDTLMNYRDKLITNKSITLMSSILIVVGRQDTGELEAQIRGSRHAWDIRLISIEALVSLVKLKENTEASETSRKIRSILAPMEYTKLDKLIEIVFTAATDLDVKDPPTQIERDEPEPDEHRETHRERTGKIQLRREQIALTISNKFGVSLIKRTRAMYWTADHSRRMICAISKRYERRGGPPYWYAYHPQWDDFLKDDPEAVFVLGCVDLPFAFAIPRTVMQTLLPGLNTTFRDENSSYWHIHINERNSGNYTIPLPKMSSIFDLKPFEMVLKT